MPVIGLPIAVESALNAILATSRVTSWKITGESDSSVFVIRLSDHDSSSRPQTFEICDNNTTVNRQPPQSWRKKPPSQIRRDIQRASNWKLNNNHQATKSSNNFDRGRRDSITIRTTDRHSDLPFDSESLTSTVVPPVSRAVGEEKDNQLQNDTGDSNRLNSFSFCKPASAEILGRDESECVRAEIRATSRKLVIANVKNRLLSLNTSVKSRLLNPKRNRHLNKIVTYKNENHIQLLAESDDYLFCYDCETATTLNYAIKCDPADLSQAERDWLHCLECQQSVRRSLYLAECAHIIKDLHALADLIRCYLL